MLPIRKVFVAVALAMASTTALAFQEERQGAAPQQPAPVAESKGGAALTPSDVPGPAASKGTEVSIPGLGKLGVIPKMNFGLELLYGAAETKRQEEEPVEADGLTIRGSIKHKF